MFHDVSSRSMKLPLHNRRHGWPTVTETRESIVVFGLTILEKSLYMVFQPL